jgi:ABC-type branched-subunit amino acid transport system permease subunit
MNRATKALVNRLLACLGGSLVLALMVGSQEGSQTAYGYEFRQSVLKPRVFVFLAIGVVIFFAITFWPKLVPYLKRPGLWPLFSGALAVVAAQALMDWYDQTGDAKFRATADAVDKSPGISALVSAFFDWLAWTQLIVVVVLGLVAIVRSLRWLAFVTAALSVVAAVIVYVSHDELINFAKSYDHSLGYAAAILGYVVVAVAMLTSALSGDEVIRARAVAIRVLSFRPGLPLAVLGAVLWLLAYSVASWFSPQDKNVSVSDLHKFFSGFGLQTITNDYLQWLEWVLFAVTLVLAAAAVWLRQRMLGWAAAVVAVVACALTLYTLYDISKVGADTQNFDGATGPWQNLGVGGWMALGGFFLLGAAGFIAATTKPVADEIIAVPGDAPSSKAPARTLSVLAASGSTRSLIFIAVAVTLFYPPTANGFWQQVLVTEIGPAIFLAVGLNVVVGWAGLLDLGFIAFYAIGSYTTAYLVGALPVKPPSWLHFSPLVAIPFAIAVCLLAGLALGAPTLRLRGDYLAIVTLGFGEIIRIVAVNVDSFTNGSQGPAGVPNPVINLGFVKIQWGLAQLQYWYLLIVLIGIIVLLFRGLEHSRLGRAWAAVREDEVAAQATGINTTRVKLMAFAIGASTSGVAGVYFASQVGSFTPDNFVLNNSILIVAYVVFGGMGSLPGAMAGAALLTWLPEFLKDQVPTSDRNMWIGAAVLVMMIFRPAGLIPARRRRIEMHGLNDAPESEPETVPEAGSLGGVTA